MRVLRWVLVLMACAAVTAWACGGGDDDGGDGSDVDLTDSCDDANFGGVDLPDEVDTAGRDDFPDDLPIYDGADFECGYSGESEGVSGVVGIFSTGDSVEDVKAFYDEEFSGDGPWMSQGSSSAAGSNFWTIQHDDDMGGFVSVSGDGDNTAITIIISDDLSNFGVDGDDSGSGDDDSTGGDSGSGDDDPSGGDEPSGGGELPDETELPDDFPSNVPLPDDIRVTNASMFSASGVSSFLVEFYSQDSIDSLAMHFKDGFEGQGWTQSFQTETNGEVFATYAEGADATGTVVTITIVASDVEGYNTVALNVANVSGE